MKSFFLTSIIVFGFFLIVNAQNKIVVQITNFNNNKGVCKACLFNSATSFNGEGGQPFQCMESVVNNKTAKVVFDQIPAGTYAVFVFHDMNDNNKMDKNFLGIPKEGYGASKNKLPFASAPTFNDNKFSIPNNTITQLTIKLRNL